jgi:hypothetical protein
MTEKSIAALEHFSMKLREARPQLAKLLVPTRWLLELLIWADTDLTDSTLS